jgi:aspartyl-tRNA(Asn)/glutamyl-tRNA(Gln) amidotransferase subunit A
MSEFLTIADALTALQAGTVSSVELVQSALTIIDQTDAELGAFVSRFDDAALTAAREADARRRSEAPTGPLLGIPIGVKDNITTRDGVTRAQSTLPDPSGLCDRKVDATALHKLRQAGCIVIGKLATMEYAIGVPDPTKPFPTPRNPWDVSRWAGGSSSGAGSAVAVGSVLGAVGTDTMASIRMPAAFCGVTGHKPTYGLVSRTGVVPLAYTLDHVGPLARSARDCALLLHSMLGFDPADAGSIDHRPDDLDITSQPQLNGVRIGFDPLDHAHSMRDAVLDKALGIALDVLRGLGAEIVPVNIPAYAEMTAAVQIIMYSEAFAYHQRMLQGRWFDYGAGTRRRLVLGGFLSAADYINAQKVRRLGIDRLAAFFADIDLLVTPTAGTAAPRIQDLEKSAGSLNSSGSLYTAYWDLTGNPATSIPIGRNGEGMPLGLQIVGKPFHDADVLRAAMGFQSQTDWHLAVPPYVSTAAQPPSR